ncbi:MAG: 6-phosphogluconolactonase, partial [Planctomycetaceae bacterium]
MPRFLPLVVALVLFLSTQFANAKDPMIFISAFAGGDQGAIHSFNFDLTTGALKPLQRTTSVQNPFFLALSPDKKFLYSIHALKFGSKDAEEIAAF